MSDELEKMKLHSPDWANENIRKLAEIFPNCVTETQDADGTIKRAINYDQLRQELSGHIVDGPQERYHLNWPGKREALLAANAPIAKTLRPARDESVNFDATQNLFIEGDNLEALKLLQETYLGKVKMIYIDPPYNTGNDFIYEDDFAESADKFLERSNQKDEDGNRLVANPDSKGRFHSDWLSMMYSRLKLAKSLLKDSGVIFASIDENEVHNLRKIMDEIFGEKNFIAKFVVQTNPRGRSLDKFVAKTFEYLVCFAKNSNSNCISLIPKDEKALKDYNEVDQGGKFRLLELRNRNPVFSRANRPNLYFPLFINEDSGKVSLVKSEECSSEVLPLNSKNEDGCWTWGEKKVRENIDLLVGKKVSTGALRVFRKDYIPDEGAKTKEKSLWLETNLNHENGKEELATLFETSGAKVPFDFPKSVHLLKKVIQIGANCEGIILDFFAGSCSTAQAIMEMNKQDGLQRKFIMVQLPEEVDPKSASAKAGYSNIAEISKERIRRAGAKILEGECHPDWNKDIGFRVLKVDTSNMKDVYYRPDEVDQSDLLSSVDNIKDGRTGEDLLFQVLVDWGVDLTLPIRHEKIEGKSVYFVDDDALIACFETGINVDFVKQLATHKPLRVIFRDNGFASDDVKANVAQIFRQTSPDTDIKVI